MSQDPDPRPLSDSGEDLLDLSHWSSDGLAALLFVGILVGLIAWQSGPSLASAVVVLIWAFCLAQSLYRFVTRRSYGLWMSRSCFIVTRKQDRWEIPFSEVAQKGEGAFWKSFNGEMKGAPHLPLLSSFEGLLADQVGERLLAAGYDLGVPGWNKVAETKAAEAWRSMPFETGAQFALMGCLIPGLGFLFTGIIIAGFAGLWLLALMVFWGGWVAIVFVIESKRTAVKFRFEGSDLLVQKRRDEPLRFSLNEVRHVRISAAPAGSRKHKVITVVTHYGREVQISRREKAWSTASSEFLNQVRARGCPIIIESRKEKE